MLLGDRDHTVKHHDFTTFAWSDTCSKQWYLLYDNCGCHWLGNSFLVAYTGTSSKTTGQVHISRSLGQVQGRSSNNIVLYLRASTSLAVRKELQCHCEDYHYQCQNMQSSWKDNNLSMRRVTFVCPWKFVLVRRLLNLIRLITTSSWHPVCTPLRLYR